MTLISSAWSLSIRLDALRCLSYVVFESGPLCVTKHQALLDLLLPMCAVQENRGVTTVDKECRRMAINCVGNLCVKCGAKMSKFYAPIFELLYSNFIRHSVEIQKDSSLAKALCSTMRALQFVMQEAKTVHESRISPFLTELKRLSFFGTPLALPPTLPSSSSTSSISSVTSSSSEGNSRKAARKNKKKPLVAAKGDDDEGEGFSFQLPKPDLPIYMGEHKAYSSSESEFGDDGDDRHIFWKVRYHALMCIHVMVRLGPAKLIYPYYPMFVPSSPHPLNYSLFTNIFNDPTAKVRIAALNVLAAIVDSSRSFMLALPLPSASTKITKSASTSSVHSSYTPVSQTLSGMVREMHNGLFATIDSEQSPIVLLHAIKCIAVLVSVAPYEKMPAGLLSSLLSRMYTSLDNKDTPVRSATLSCLACVFSTRVAHAEISHALSSILTTTPPSSPIRGAAPSTPTFPTHPTPSNPTSIPLSPLLEALLRASSVQDIPNIRAEALHVLGSLSKHYFDILCEAWDRILQLVVGGLKDTEGIVRYHAAKFLEDFTKSLLDLETNGVATKLDGRTVWERLLQGGAITEFINDTSPQVRASICTTFSHISPKAAEVLELDQRITMLSLVSSLISDEQPNVRAAAARTIGVYILIPVFREDASFVCDAATQLVAAMDDQNLNVRIRACWSLANLCDSLVSLQDSPVIEDIPVTIIVSVCVCCLKATHENDKIKCNAVRALGNFARFAPHVLLCHSPAISHPPNNSPNNAQPTLLCRVARSLVDSLLSPDSSTPNSNPNNNSKPSNQNASANSAGSSAVKVRWNACYAIGNLLRNKDVFIDDQKSWLPQVFDALTNITKMGKNFKIRINAAMALAVISDREHYGEHFCNILRAVIEGLENMEEIEDFSEFKYKENLHLQLGNTCAHLVSLAAASDMENLSDILTTKYSVIFTTLDFLHSKQPAPSLPEIYNKFRGFYASKNITDATNKFDKRISQLQEEVKDKPT
eukprot:Phypoly_transcript_01432.p1 GENE.Phypoly_transcript_01432~~Phypoly_transcript_01432.p1  ORF type:complete len:1125 (+),score=151.07 Phypoly_transcript_01432:404-3376(+)